MLTRLAFSCLLLVTLAACGSTTPTSLATPIAPSPAVSSTVQSPSAPADTAIARPPATSTPIALDVPTPVAVPISWPDCVSPVDVPIDLPANFAPHIPFPESTRLFKSSVLRNDIHIQLQVTGIVLLSLADSAHYLNAELPRNGYVITGSDSEANEVDALFKGNGWIGSYRVNAIDNCPSASMWTIRVLKL
jgi:hypothetical protein